MLGFTRGKYCKITEENSGIVNEILKWLIIKKALLIKVAPLSLKPSIIW